MGTNPQLYNLRLIDEAIEDHKKNVISSSLRHLILCFLHDLYNGLTEITTGELSYSRTEKSDEEGFEAHWEVLHGGERVKYSAKGRSFGSALDELLERLMLLSRVKEVEEDDQS